MKIDMPLLTAWPRGYKSGRFWLVPGGVKIAARGKPTLWLEDEECRNPNDHGAHVQDAGSPIRLGESGTSASREPHRRRRARRNGSR
jgi:hypothetical protein